MDAAAAADVERAVRAYLAVDDPDGAAGPVLELDQLAAAAGLEPPSETAIRSLTVLSVGDDEAHVELDAVQHFVSHTKRGREKRWSVSIGGPLRAGRDHGEWKVVDHCIDGRPISESYSVLDGDAVRTHGVSLRLNSILIGRRHVAAFVAVENDGVEPATIGDVSLVAKRCQAPGGQSCSELGPGSSTLALGWRKSLSTRIRALRVTMLVRTPRGAGEVCWNVDLPARHADASARLRGRLRVLLCDPKTPWALLGLFFVADSAVFGLPSLTLVVGLALAMALTIALVFVHYWLQGR